HTTHHMGNIISRKLSPNPVVPCEGIKAERKRKTQDLCTDSDGFTLDLQMLLQPPVPLRQRRGESRQDSHLLRLDLEPSQAGSGTFSGWIWNLLRLDLEPSQAGSGTFSGWIWNLLRLSGG
ncbi:hypothetical protein KUCAC02_020432, partial [Chaenocephalus aceratus]